MESQYVECPNYKSYREESVMYLFIWNGLVVLNIFDWRYLCGFYGTLACGVLCHFKIPLLCLQYKFVVDGEWRHDVHQPFVSSNIGTVNTILLTRESDYLTPMLSPQVPPSGHGSSMDVDNEAFQRVVCYCCIHVYFFFHNCLILIIFSTKGLELLFG